ncbi:MAG: endolytic transglycosylase MltG [Candidatus Altimarinota bacterium]
MRKRTYSKRSSTSKWLKIVGALVLLALIVAGYFYTRYDYLIKTPVIAGNQEEILFNIKKGDTSKTIADRLIAENLILDADSFKLYARLNNLDKDIKTGRFGLTKGQNTIEILAKITSNQQKELIVTIPEGSNIREIDQLLTEQGIITAGEFTSATQAFTNYQKYPFLNKAELENLKYPLEGYLFPDTYYVAAADFHPDQLISIMLKTFQSKALPFLEESDRSITETVNVAAMVEEEANQDQDRPVIAGIIWKRLDENWLLGIDATLLYESENREITYQDLQEDHPYNTRKNMGLPPGPITNPGLESLKAAAEPEASPYYYYLTSSITGDMVYAETDAKHNQNKREHL